MAASNINNLTRAEDEWYSCLVSNQGPSDPQSDALTN